ncbi:MAG TPA: 2-phospho-L-lactate transferase [Solirubrobacterales bacterium]|nr:2-phospho-L-lactate transferase [Solirubrobacterales bacterium]
MRIAVLAGGTGGAKLAAGLQDIVGSDLGVIANNGDDVEALGVHVSPDPDLITYWLDGEIDPERGWGIRGDTSTVFERLVQLGAPDWFRLTDRDLATCLRRRQMLDQGARLTEAQAQIVSGLGIAARVLPMSDDPVRTRVRTPAGWRALQEYLILDRAEPPIEEVELAGVREAEPTPEVLAAIATADAIVIGPSNPVISIGPILAVAGIRDAIAASSAPVVAVSPFVAGRAIKGPTEPFMRAVGVDPSAAGIVATYGELLDGIVVDASDPDPPPDRPASLAIPTLMDDAAARRLVAERTLEFAAGLRGR